MLFIIINCYNLTCMQYYYVYNFSILWQRRCSCQKIITVQAHTFFRNEVIFLCNMPQWYLISQLLKKIDISSTVVLYPVTKATKQFHDFIIQFVTHISNILLHTLKHKCISAQNVLVLLDFVSTHIMSLTVIFWHEIIKQPKKVKLS